MSLPIVEILLLSLFASIFITRGEEVEAGHPIDGRSMLSVFVLTFLALLGVSIACRTIANHPVILSPPGMLILTMAAMVVAASGIGRQIAGAVHALNDWLRTIDDHISGKP